MALFENKRIIKISLEFDGTVGNGANGAISFPSSYYYMNKGEVVYEVFYRVTTTLTSGDTAGTYIKMGLLVDDTDAIFTTTTGIIDTLNSGATGTKPAHAYAEATIDSRDFYAEVGGTNDITGGAIEVFITVVRGNVLEEGYEESVSIPGAGNIGVE